MKFIDKRIEDYALSKSTTPCSLLDELERSTYESFDLPQMMSGKLVASFLQTFIKSTRAEQILEVGTFVGYGSLVMAQALPENGKLITLDIDENCVNFAKKFWERSDHGYKIEAHIGPALDYMNELGDKFDLIFIDADKKNYLNYFKRSLELLSDTGVIIVDNVLWGGSVLEQEIDESTQAIKDLNDYIAESDHLHKTLVPIRDGLFLVTKV